MKDVVFQLERNSLKGWNPLLKKKFKWPESFDELSVKQMTSIGEVYAKSIPIDVSYLEIFFGVSGVSKGWVKKFMTADEIDAYITQSLVKPLLERKIIEKGIFKNAVSGFTGPDDRLKNMTWQQYYLCQAFLDAYEESHKMEHLNTLCALLFYKDSFNKEEADKYIGLWAKKSYGFKIAVYMVFVYQSAVLNILYPALFKKPSETTIKPAKKKKPDFRQLTINLSGGPFGTREQLDREPLHNVLKYLEMRIIEDSKKPKK